MGMCGITWRRHKSDLRHSSKYVHEEPLVLSAGLWIKVVKLPDFVLTGIKLQTLHIFLQSTAWNVFRKKAESFPRRTSSS